MQHPVLTEDGATALRLSHPTQLLHSYRARSEMPHQSDFCTIEEALAELRAGRMIVLVDDEHRENEGDLVIPAEKVTPEAINFMVRNGCGILGLSLSAAICDWLDLEPLPGKKVGVRATQWTQQIDACNSICEGPSAISR